MLGWERRAMAWAPPLSPERPPGGWAPPGRFRRGHTLGGSREAAAGSGAFVLHRRHRLVGGPRARVLHHGEGAAGVRLAGGGLLVVIRVAGGGGRGGADLLVRGAREEVQPRQPALAVR